MLFKTTPTSLIAPNLYSVNNRIVNFYVYKQDTFGICFDTGFGVSKIEKELKKINIAPEDITHIFLTHTDKDHTDGIKLFANAKIYMSRLEEPLTNGEIKRSPITKISRLERTYETLSDGDSITIGSVKIKALSTPGHTVGSMSYLLNDHILFVGDTFDLEKGKSTIGRKFFSMDANLQKESIVKLSKLKDISLLCTAHTGISKNFDLAMKEWIT
jgi:hydroxyacylglutathione hydrolase